RVAILGVRMDGRSFAVPGEGVRLTISGALDPTRIAAWRAGRVASAPVVFRRPARYLDDGVEDAERTLLLDGTVLFGSVKSGLLVDVLERGSLIVEAAAGVRAHVRRAIETFVGSRDPVAAGIVTAVLIGDRTGLPDEIRTRL